MENAVMAPTRQPGEALKSIRLDLSEEDHHALRRAAADANMSMAAYARKVVSESVKGYRPARKREIAK
jgi:hypothetical protein